MSSSLLEQTRALHADVDTYHKLVTEKLRKPKRSYREALYQEHRIADLLDHISSARRKLKTIYEDAQGADMEQMTGAASLNQFYDRLNALRELHRDDGLLQAVVPTNYVEKEVPVEFSGPEGYGRFLDMYAFHERVLNMKAFDHTDYLNFLRIFYKFDRVPKAAKNAAYKQLVDDMFAYLFGFMRRVLPLLDADGDLRETDSKFEAAWVAGSVPGWDASDATTADDPLFCKACEKRFAKQTVFDAHLTGKKHKSAAAALQSRATEVAAGASNGAAAASSDASASAATSSTSAPAAASATAETFAKQTARSEFRIAHLVQVLSNKLEATISHQQKKLASTFEELEADLLDMENEQEPESDKEGDDSDNEVKVNTNPLKLPIGWDGKPIPYWLWKLHRLGEEYVCEICGNTTYFGPKNFEKHFQEYRHQFGMRCLRIPNTTHFHNITRISDAYALFKKLKESGTVRDFDPANDEEMEDTEGNVMPKKTYLDLKRQGLA